MKNLKEEGNRMMGELPEGWELTALEHIAKWGSGGTPSRKTLTNYIGPISWIKTGELGPKFIYHSEEHISEDALKKSSAKLFPKGGGCIAMYGATIGKTSILGIESATNQACAVAVTDSDFISNLYLYEYLTSQKRAFTKVGIGGAQPNISQTLLKAWPFPLPPLNEQKRIVTKIEELFSELDAGEESFKQARKRLGIYRQSLLKQAFEGKLTEQWRADNPDQLEDPETLLARIQQERESRHQQQLTNWQQAVEVWEENGKEGKKLAKPRKPIELAHLTKEEISELSNLAETWIWLHLDGICKVLSGYAFKSQDFCETGVPVIKIANVSYGEFVIKTQQYLPEEFLESSKDFVIYPDDLLIALTRPITNNKTKVCEYPKDSPFALLNQRVAALKDLSIHKEYLLFFANSKQFKESIRSKFSETLQPNLSPKDLSETPIPLCSLPEQQEIVSLLEEQFTVIEQNERKIDAALKRSEALRQSILKRAFSGQLVPQDPTDEPASQLLTRIQAERTAQEALAKSTQTAKKKAKKKTTRKRKT